MKQCKQCGTVVADNYCPHCGQISEVKRIDFKYIRKQVERLIYLDRSMFYTVKVLLIHPAKSIKEYLTENRNRLVTPVFFVIICSLLYTLANRFFKFQVVDNEAYGNSLLSSSVNWMYNHYDYTSMLTGLFIALFLKLFFRKSHYNYYEVLVLLCYVMGESLIIATAFGTLQGIIHYEIFNLSMIIVIIYLAWSIGSFFKPKAIASYIKALFAYLLGLLTFVILVVIGTILIEHWVN